MNGELGKIRLAPMFFLFTVTIIFGQVPPHWNDGFKCLSLSCLFFIVIVLKLLVCRLVVIIKNHVTRLWEYNAFPIYFRLLGYCSYVDVIQTNNALGW